MKKLLVLTLVLGIASLATAGLSFEMALTNPAGPGSDAGNQASGEVITVDLVVSAGDTSAAYLQNTGKYVLSLTNATFVGGQTAAGLTYSNMFWGIAGVKNLAYVGDTMELQAGYIGLPSLGTGVAMDAVSVSGIQIQTADGLGNAILTVTPINVANPWGVAQYSTTGTDLVDDSSATGSALTIYQTPVPEPATMALLGLGALVLRRKK